MPPQHEPPRSVQVVCAQHALSCRPRAMAQGPRRSPRPPHLQQQALPQVVKVGKGVERLGAGAEPRQVAGGQVAQDIHDGLIAEPGQPAKAGVAHGVGPARECQRVQRQHAVGVRHRALLAARRLPCWAAAAGRLHSGGTWAFGGRSRSRSGPANAACGAGHYDVCLPFSSCVGQTDSCARLGADLQAGAAGPCPVTANARRDVMLGATSTNAPPPEAPHPTAASREGHGGVACACR